MREVEKRRSPVDEKTFSSIEVSGVLRSDAVNSISSRGYRESLG